jgi:hypothetical protein
MTLNPDKTLLSFAISKDDHFYLKEISRVKDCSISSLIRKGIKSVIAENSYIIQYKEDNHSSPDSSDSLYGDPLMEIVDSITDISTDD